MPFNRVPRPILSIAVGTKAFSFRHYPVQRIQSRWYIQQLSNEAIWAHLQWNNYTKWNMAHIILAACHSLRNMTRTFSVLANDSVTPYRGNQSEKTCSWSGAKTDDSRRAKKKFPSSVSYMLRSVACICYIFIHKISFSVNISKNSMAQFTPEEMVKAILEEPRARTLMEKLICETVSPKVSSTYIRNFVSHTWAAL